MKIRVIITLLGCIWSDVTIAGTGCMGKIEALCAIHSVEDCNSYKMPYRYEDEDYSKVQSNEGALTAWLNMHRRNLSLGGSAISKDIEQCYVDFYERRLSELK